MVVKYKNLKKSTFPVFKFLSKVRFSKPRFIGVTEGDGSFTYNGRYPRFEITQGVSGLKLLYIIQQWLGFGSIYPKDKSKQAFDLYVSDKENLKKLIKIFNGNLRLLWRRKQFESWLKRFNEVYGESIELLPWNKKPSLDDSWLSAFSDAEGCFAVSIKKPKKRKKTGWMISEINNIWSVGQSEHYIIEKISALFKGGKKYEKIKKSKTPHWVAVTDNQPANAQVIDYFLKFPPYHPEKIVSLGFWIIIYNMVVAGKHLNPEGLAKIKILVKRINRHTKEKKLKRLYKKNKKLLNKKNKN